MTSRRRYRNNGAAAAAAAVGPRRVRRPDVGVVETGRNSVERRPVVRLELVLRLGFLFFPVFMSTASVYNSVKLGKTMNTSW